MKIGLTAIVAIVVFLFASIVSVHATAGIDMNSLELKLNGETIDNGTHLAVMKNEDITAQVCFTPTQDVDANFQFELIGGSFRELDMTANTGNSVHYFANVKDCADATFNINDKVNMGNYTLRVFSFDQTSLSSQSVKDYTIYIVGKNSDIVFDKVSMADTVMAGQDISPKVFIRNDGRTSQSRVDVTAELMNTDGTTVLAKSNIVSVEKLNVNSMNKPSEEMDILVPPTLAPGTYEVQFIAQYDNDFSTSTYSQPITVEKCLGQCAGKIVSTPDTEVVAAVNDKQVEIGSSVVFPISIANDGSVTNAYTVKVDGADDFAVADVQPTNFFSVEAGKAKDINVVLTPKADAKVGDHAFTVTVLAGNDVVVQQLSFVATVANDNSNNNSSWGLLKNGLGIGFIVLLALLVVLVLIVILNKFKGDKDNDDEEDLKGQTYY